MEIIAHRCNGFGYGENSIRAVRAALASPVDAIEIDVRLTKDLKWVVIHNPFVRERAIVRKVHEHPYSALKRDVTSLDAVLALVAAAGGSKELYIDVKDVGEERALLRTLRRHDLLPRTVIIAWEREVLVRIHALAPEARLGFSYVPIPSQLARVQVSTHKPRTRHGLLLRFNELHTFDPALAIGRTHQHYLSEIPDLPLVSIQVYALFCTARLVRDAHARGIKVVAFPINNRIAAAVMRRRGVDAILTNEPALFLEQ